MTLGEALREAVGRLAESRVGSPRMNAEVLLMFSLGCDRAYLYAHPERALSQDEQARYDEALAQRARGVPAQYITGHQEFWGLDFIVNPAVLIPRPETEHLVEAVLSLARGGAGRGRPPSSFPSVIPFQVEHRTSKTETEAETIRIVDVGSGSGCVALALAHELPNAEILAVDISAEALEVARANAVRLQLDHRVRFEQRDVLDKVSKVSEVAKVQGETSETSETFDFVVSNPPYVGASEEDKVQLEVRKYEPRMAVFAGVEGLDIIRRLIPQACDALSPRGWLLMEIGFSMEAAVRALLDGWSEVHSFPDLQGIPRVVAARK
ncbi:MAG TPA: peptide chain release factor N(5)-glutamine methyltransferase [Terriglobales bacterium]|nr:peptide chain release factor N(5)-glutamine methyltransferase [Terriglobales bacterium]